VTFAAATATAGSVADSARAVEHALAARAGPDEARDLALGADVEGTRGVPPTLESWPTYLHDDQHTGRTSASIDPAGLSTKPAWSAPVGYSVPLIVGNRIYAMASQFGIGEDLTRIAAFDLTSGDVLWEKEQSLIFPSAPTYHDGWLVYTAITQPEFDRLLFVRDADTGEVVYFVPIPNPLVQMPTIHVDADSGEIVAYLSAPAITNFGIGPSMTAVTLGPVSGAVKWQDDVPRNFGDVSIPTIVEDSLVVVGAAHYYAYDLETGEIAEFHNGGGTGGSGTTAAYDGERRQIYILSAYDENGDALTAWHYGGLHDIQRVWTSPETVITGGDGVAIDDQGYLWAASYDSLLKIDPATGLRVDGVTGGNFAIQMVPIVAGDFVFTFGSSMFSDTVVYDRDSLEVVQRLPGARGDLNSAFDAPGAIADGVFALDRGRIYDYPGFSVFLPLVRTCGNPAGSDERISATDALATLQAAVGLFDCDACLCDANGSGGISATDALIVLRVAIDLPAALACPPCM
jgi:hypothetical protein